MSANLIKLGLSAIAIAFVLSLFAMAAAAVAARGNRPAFLVSARHALIVNAVLVSLAAFTLIWSFVVADFSVLYVAENANSRLPLLYRITGMWGAHEGSLLLWLWYLCMFSMIAVIVHWRDHPLSMPWIIATLAAVQAGFIGFIIFLSSPFREILPAPPDGRDLNPLLQDPGLAFHPPLLYMGYVAFAVPFAFAVASLIRGHAGPEWVRAVRRWTLFAWTALTSGIMLGGYWAYYELGWGGYWAWDPVENASLLPWLTGTAFLHSIMAQDRRGLFRSWNVFLIVTTFALSLLGTFLVRSGVLTSVHSFAVDPGRGTYMLVFLAVVMVIGYGLVILRAERLAGTGDIESVWSREAMLLVNNLFLVSAAAVVLLGTLYPLIVEAVSGDRVTVGAPYFNKATVPMMVAVVFLMGIGPMVPWRRIAARRLRDMLRLPAI
ncbi:MAG: heme lyase CcmF/NrfE family subunit, partial [Xanthobacteraceae bacterium]